MKLEDLALITCVILVLLALLTLVIFLTRFPYGNYLIPALLGTVWLIIVLALGGIVVALLHQPPQTKKNNEAQSKSKP